MKKDCQDTTDLLGQIQGFSLVSLVKAFPGQSLANLEFVNFRNLDIQHTLCFIFEFDSILQTSSDKLCVWIICPCKNRSSSCATISLLVLHYGNRKYN